MESDFDMKDSEISSANWMGNVALSSNPKVKMKAASGEEYHFSNSSSGGRMAPKSIAELQVRKFVSKTISSSWLVQAEAAELNQQKQLPEVAITNQ